METYCLHQLQIGVLMLIYPYANPEPMSKYQRRKQKGREEESFQESSV